jgi:5-methyltetrahydropteroyltriglutamate--homocysteine methyltransferase
VASVGEIEAGGSRLRTTHVGSLPRPGGVAKLLSDRDSGTGFDREAFDAAIGSAVAEVVRRQVEVGIDVVSDGEMSKISYSTYVKDRLTGFGGDSQRRPALDLAPYPGLRARMAAASGGAQSFQRQSCVGPVSYAGHADLAADLAHLRAAVDACGASSAFLNAASPGLVTAFQPNEHYPSHDEYVAAVGEAMQHEYEAIVDAGFLLQLDCPDLAMARHTGFQDLTDAEFLARAELHVEVLNHATRRIDPQRMRMHLCWGNYEGPHDHDIPLAAILPIVLRARPATVLFEAANPRHSHEWEVWAGASIPDTKILAPGVITSTVNYVDHPRRVAQLLRPYVDLVGPDRVLAATDCGFGTFAGIGRVDPDVVLKKLASLVAGAALATSGYKKLVDPEPGPVLVERACERLVIDSAAHNDAKDWAALAALYTPDARLERPSGQVVEGREAIEAAYRAGPADRRSRHVCTNIRVVIDGPRAASATTTVLLYAWTAPAGGEPGGGELPVAAPPTLGEFADSFALTGGGWRISSRRARLLARPDTP